MSENAKSSESLEDQDSDFLSGLNQKLAASVRGVYGGISHDEIVSETLALSAKNPDWSQRRRAKSVVNTCIKQCGGAGLTAASVSMIPGIGVGIAYGSIIPEELYVLRSLFVMVLRIGNIYGFSPEAVGFDVALGLVGREELASPDLGKTLRTSMLRKTVTKAVDRMVSKVLAGRLVAGVEEGVIRRALVSSTLLKGVVKRLPLLGLAIGSGMNIYAADSVGRRAIHYFARETV
ncbi:hypothetical protein WDW86_03475 [Bdellovibrionota bacterium FG-2]